MINRLPRYLGTCYLGSYRRYPVYWYQGTCVSKWFGAGPARINVDWRVCAPGRSTHFIIHQSCYTAMSTGWWLVCRVHETGNTIDWPPGFVHIVLVPRFSYAATEGRNMSVKVSILYMSTEC